MEIARFLNDGVLQFKKKFNISLVQESRRKILYLNPLSFSRPATNFLKSNPFIRSENGRFIATAFDDSASGHRTDERLWQQQGQTIAGIESVERIDLAKIRAALTSLSAENASFAALTTQRVGVVVQQRRDMEYYFQAARSDILAGFWRRDLFEFRAIDEIPHIRTRSIQRDLSDSFTPAFQPVETFEHRIPVVVSGPGNADSPNNPSKLSAELLSLSNCSLLGKIEHW